MSSLSPAQIEFSKLAGGLSAIDLVWGHEPEECGREALRYLQAAGKTWVDLFEPMASVDPSLCGTNEWWRTWATSKAPYARAVLERLHLATPAQLARSAAAICDPLSAGNSMGETQRLIEDLNDAWLAEVTNPAASYSGDTR